MLKLKDPYTVQLSYDAHKSICNLPCTDPPPLPSVEIGRGGGVCTQAKQAFVGRKEIRAPLKTPKVVK